MRARSFFQAWQGVPTVCGLVVLLSMCARRPVATSVGSDRGAQVYEANCVRCHGMDGTRKKWWAKDLRASRLPEEKVKEQIREGKGFMPAFRKKLTAEEIDAVARHVMQLREP